MKQFFLKQKIKSHYVWLLLIIVLATGLRLYNIQAEAYWGDEVLSLDIVRHYQDNLVGMVNYINSIEVHPPLYYLMLAGWMKYFGYHELSLRLLSLFFGLGVILLSYLLIRKLFNDKNLALLVAFLVAILPMQIEFSQEARPYIIFTFCGLLAALFYWLYREKRKNVFLLGYFIFNLAGCLLHYSYVFFAAGLAFFWLFEIFLDKDKSRRARNFTIWFTVNGLMAAAYYWQAVALLYKILLGQEMVIDLSRTVTNLRQVDFFETIINQIIWLSKNAPVTKIEAFAALLFKVIFSASMFWLLIKQTEKFKLALVDHGRQLIFIFWLFIVPMFLFFISPHGAFYAPIYERHVILSSVFVVMIIAYFADQLKPKLKLLVIIMFIVSLTTSIVLVLDNDTTWDHTHRLNVWADHINHGYQPGDMVIIYSSFVRSDFNYYLNDNITAFGLYPLSLLDYHDDFLASRQTLGLVENESQLRFDHNWSNSQKRMNKKMDYLVGKYEHNRIWLVGCDRDIYIKQWLTQNGWKEAMVSLGDLFPVQMYVKR